METKTTIQIDKDVRLNLKKIALEMNDLTLNETIKELIKFYESNNKDIHRK